MESVEIINEYKDQVRILKQQINELEDAGKSKDAANKRCLQKLEFSTTELDKALIKIKELEDKNLIPFKYCGENGNINEENNPNGSLNNIAGIFNNKKNILGMMPHPERMVDQVTSGTDGVNLFTSLLN